MAVCIMKQPANVAISNPLKATQITHIHERSGNCWITKLVGPDAVVNGGKVVRFAFRCRRHRRVDQAKVLLKAYVQRMRPERRGARLCSLRTSSIGQVALMNE